MYNNLFTNTLNVASAIKYVLYDRSRGNRPRNGFLSYVFLTAELSKVNAIKNHNKSTGGINFRKFCGVCSVFRNKDETSRDDFYAHYCE